MHCQIKYIILNSCVDGNLFFLLLNFTQSRRNSSSPNLRPYFEIFLQGLRETKENLRNDSPSPAKTSRKTLLNTSISKAIFFIRQSTLKSTIKL